jgi:hypothetical protein
MVISHTTIAVLLPPNGACTAGARELTRTAGLWGTPIDRDNPSLLIAFGDCIVASRRNYAL